MMTSTFSLFSSNVNYCACANNSKISWTFCIEYHGTFIRWTIKLNFGQYFFGLISMMTAHVEK